MGQIKRVFFIPPIPIAIISFSEFSPGFQDSSTPNSGQYSNRARSYENRLIRHRLWRRVWWRRRSEFRKQWQERSAVPASIDCHCANPKSGYVRRWQGPGRTGDPRFSEITMNVKAFCQQTSNNPREFLKGLAHLTKGSAGFKASEGSSFSVVHDKATQTNEKYFPRMTRCRNVVYTPSQTINILNLLIS